jgi:hypothetical protein
MGVLGPVIQILRGSVLHRGHYHAVRGPVAAQFVGDDHPWHVPQSLQQLTKEPGGGLGVAPGGDQDVQNTPVLVDRPPQVVGLSVDLDEYLVEVPLIPGAWPPAAQPVRVGLPELLAPLPEGLVGNHDAALHHHLFDLAEAEREPMIQPHTVTDDLHRVPEPLVRGRNGGHQPSPSLPRSTRPIIPNCRQPHQVDSAPGVCRHGRATSINNGVKRCTHRYTVTWVKRRSCTTM